MGDASDGNEGNDEADRCGGDDGEKEKLKWSPGKRSAGGEVMLGGVQEWAAVCKGTRKSG